MAVHDVVKYILNQTGPIPAMKRLWNGHNFILGLNILNQTGPIPAMKLQKLVYYCQAWSLV